MEQKKALVFIDSDPFTIDVAHVEDPRAPVTRRFLDAMRASGRGVTSAFNVLEVAGAVSHTSTPDEVARLTKVFSKDFGVRIAPPAAESIVLDMREIQDRLRRRMGVGDAIVLWQAESYRPAVEMLVR
ncbi:MAG: hypothetical protein ACOZIN_00270 [Myxococcota bacterium]